MAFDLPLTQMSLEDKVQAMELLWAELSKNPEQVVSPAWHGEELYSMKIRYFPDTDTLHIELADRVSSSSEAVSDNLIVDFDELGKPVGVTLEHYSQISDNSTIETLLPMSPMLQPA
ncbi:MAG: hypothetical protein RLZZ274_1243 [Cyanobacteriota bacterium]|jgi:uncharacterized protein YuzE